MKLYRSLFVALGLLAAGHMAFAGGRLDGKDREKQELNRHEQVAPALMGAQAAEDLDEGLQVRQESPSQSTPAAATKEVAPQAQSSDVVDFQDFKAERMSRADKKAMKERFRAKRKELRGKIKAERKEKSDSPSGDTDLLLLVIIAIFIPPLAVGLYEGITTNFWIDLILTLLFFVPGLIFALVVLLR